MVIQNPLHFEMPSAPSKPGNKKNENPCNGMRILSNHSYQFSNIHFKQKRIVRVNLMRDIVKQHLKDITMTRLKILVKPLFMAVVEEMKIDIQLKKIVLKHVFLKVNYNDKKSNGFFHQKKDIL